MHLATSEPANAALIVRLSFIGIVLGLAAMAFPALAMEPGRNQRVRLRILAAGFALTEAALVWPLIAFRGQAVEVINAWIAPLITSPDVYLGVSLVAPYITFRVCRRITRTDDRGRVIDAVLNAEAAEPQKLPATVRELVELPGGYDLDSIRRQCRKHHPGGPERADAAFARIFGEIAGIDALRFRRRDQAMRFADAAQLVAGGRVAILRYTDEPTSIVGAREWLRQRGVRAFVTVDGDRLWAERSRSETSPIDGRSVRAVIATAREQIGARETDWIVDPWRGGLNWLPRTDDRASKVDPEALAGAIAQDLRPMWRELPARALRWARLRGSVIGRRSRPRPAR